MKVTSSFGNQEKYRLKGVWYKVDAYGYEGLAETLSSLFYSGWVNKIKFVEYSEVSFRDGRRGCKSIDFLGDRYEIVTLTRIFEKLGININKFYKSKSTLQQIEVTLNLLYTEFKLDSSLYFAHQFTLDAFVMNEDRHLNNIIFLRDKTTGLLYSGPLFDQGMGLLARTTAFPLREPLSASLKRVKCQPFSVDFGKQASAIQALTNFTPEIPKESFEVVRLHKSEIYNQDEILRALRVLRFSAEKTKMNWRLL